jgi:hypothetical protein
MILDYLKQLLLVGNEYRSILVLASGRPDGRLCCALRFPARACNPCPTLTPACLALRQRFVCPRGVHAA